MAKKHTGDAGDETNYKTSPLSEGYIGKQSLEETSVEELSSWLIEAIRKSNGLELTCTKKMTTLMQLLLQELALRAD